MIRPWFRINELKPISSAKFFSIDHLEIFNNWLQYRDMIAGDCDVKALLQGS